MVKLNHGERGIVIAALMLARKTWNVKAVEQRTAGHADEANRLSKDVEHARDLCARFEEEQS